MIIDIEKIKALLASSATGYDIELKTGISRTQIGNYRKDPEKVMKMSLENAMKLQNYYEEENNMQRKEMVQQIYKMAEESGFTVKQGGRWDVVLQPKTDEQVEDAKKIAAIYEEVGFIDGHRFNISVRRF